MLEQLQDMKCEEKSIDVFLNLWHEIRFMVPEPVGYKVTDGGFLRACWEGFSIEVRPSGTCVYRAGKEIKICNVGAMGEVIFKERKAIC